MGRRKLGTVGVPGGGIEAESTLSADEDDDDEEEAKLLDAGELDGGTAPLLDPNAVTSLPTFLKDEKNPLPAPLSLLDVVETDVAVGDDNDEVVEV